MEPIDRPHSKKTAEWPEWKRWLTSAALLFHFAAMLAVALAGNPASEIQRAFAGLFANYVEFTGLGSVHRYYAPAPPPTPVLTAEIQFRDGRLHQVRIPDRSIHPRLRYQRQLALAFHLYGEYQRAAHDPAGPQPSRWGNSYAQHLFAENPGATKVTLRAQQHLIPDLVRLHELSHQGISPDLKNDDESFYTVPELVGEYSRPESSHR